eukprot:CAMPEP_0197179046 /NCGR_PEP_ID=MMETSP1423-20130617/4121_1 /TAXON_ID=476441 /ORGANISM="Pseudo-nitzschia heimii, Strain UNC1101" /LENGTH=496 /DNA_ID=CAMNT_0042628895 /DNA_START=85 /DNA_END=1575 /DNA_ORIENTATION=-
MFVDTASAVVDFVYLSIYGYIDSFLKAVGVQGSTTSSNDSNYDYADARKKSKCIDKCLGTLDSVDLWELRELALSEGGLLRAHYRQKAWPKLVGITDDGDVPELIPSTTDSQSTPSTRSLSDDESEYGPSTKSDENILKRSELEANVDLIRRDAGRSVIFRYKNETSDSAPLTPPYAGERLAQVLENVIKQGNASLHYYQGLHDIAGVVLYHMDYQVNAATQILKRISNSHLRDAMRENFSNINWFLNVLLPPLVGRVDRYVHYTLQMSEIELATICLPWMITWFTHDIHDPDTAGRLVDAFLSGHPLMPVYFAVALITHPVLKKELVNADCDDPSTVFMTIKKMPSKIQTTKKNAFPRSHKQQEQCIPLQEVLEDSISIMNRMPPRSLVDLVDSDVYSRAELLRRISSISLFKAPASWSMASGGVPRSLKELNESHCVRAKLASGVPILMNTVAQSTVIERKSWGSQKHLHKQKTMKMRKFIRIILGTTSKGKHS